VPVPDPDPRFDDHRALDHPDVARRALLGGGLAAVVGLGVAACSTAGQSTPDTGRSVPGVTRGTGVPSGTGAPAGGTGSGSVSSASPASGADPGQSTSAGPASGSTPDAVPALLRTPGPDVLRAASSAPAVALTFHGAGEPALTRKALSIVAEHGAQVTVFAVGTWLSAHPDLGRAIVGAGHDLGNHTWSHQTLPRLSASAARTEIARGAQAVAAISGSAAYLFRPSGTPSSTPRIRAAARASGYARCISFDVDPADYEDPGSAAVAARTLAKVRAGSIVSLHLGHAGTITALPTILTGLAARSLRPVTVTRLLA
jgi:peptidoglycan/xylan/chitin deacetylase (PgdA/CDA1 family)